MVQLRPRGGCKRDPSDATRRDDSDLRRLPRPSSRSGLHFRSRQPCREPEGIRSSAPFGRCRKKADEQHQRIGSANALGIARRRRPNVRSRAARKSVVWISQGYGTELNPSAIRDSTVAALNDAYVSVYAVDARFNPTCEAPLAPPAGQGGMVALTCSQPPDISDEWMEYVARATGGRAFSGGNASGVQERDATGKMQWSNASDGERSWRHHRGAPIRRG